MKSFTADEIKAEIFNFEKRALELFWEWATKNRPALRTKKVYMDSKDANFKLFKQSGDVIIADANSKGFVVKFVSDQRDGNYMSMVIGDDDA